MYKTWSTPVQDEARLKIPCALCDGEDFVPYLRCAGFAYVRCKRCSLVQMNPQPDEAAVKRRYSGADYFEYELENEKAFFNLGLLALADAGFYAIEEGLRPEERRVLDIGCATGALLGYLAGRGWRAEGVEINGKQAEYARRERGLTIHERPLEENQFPTGSFSVIIASHLIEHLRRPHSFLAETRRILTPRGHLLLTTPNCTGFQARLYANKWRSAIFDHLYLFSVKTISRLLREEGFHIEKTVTWGGLAAGSAPRPVKTLFDKLAKPLGFGDVVMIKAAAPLFQCLKFNR
ncbi:MAG: class I SAM-dependent methyltransferase [Spirochaetaceae bacterium]|jgi:2-polyprenyl-3-methyl-5-hydroxy-6-metoxy-1,4-benzoquinol methylase|nr:class I SAM-dependent methyltransferase [Spirochaetaceae bacterium]